MNTWTSNQPSWNEKSIRLLLSISSLSPAMIVINPKKEDLFWNPNGSDMYGPAQVTYTKINDDVTIHVEHKIKKASKKS